MSVSRYSDLEVRMTEIEETLEVRRTGQLEGPGGGLWGRYKPEVGEWLSRRWESLLPSTAPCCAARAASLFYDVGSVGELAAYSKPRQDVTSISRFFSENDVNTTGVLEGL